jgi:hypothetical protein
MRDVVIVLCILGLAGSLYAAIKRWYIQGSLMTMGHEDIDSWLRQFNEFLDAVNSNEEYPDVVRAYWKEKLRPLAQINLEWGTPWELPEDLRRSLLTRDFLKDVGYLIRSCDLSDKDQEILKRLFEPIARTGRVSAFESAMSLLLLAIVMLGLILWLGN